jgi:hypothetical protein
MPRISPLQAALTRIAELEKALESEKNQAKWARDGRESAQKELSDAHAIIDVLPGVLPQEKKDYGTNPLAVRIASWLASKQ